MKHGAGICGMCYHQLAKLFPAKEFATKVWRFGDPIGIDYDPVTWCEVPLLHGEFSIFQNAHRHRCSLQVLIAAIRRNDDGRALTGIDVAEPATALQQAVEDSGVLAAFGALVEKTIQASDPLGHQFRA